MTLSRMALIFAGCLVGISSLGMHCDGPCPDAPSHQSFEVTAPHAIGPQLMRWELYGDRKGSLRGVASAKLTVSAGRRVVVALVDSAGSNADVEAAIGNPGALVSRLTRQEGRVGGVLPLLEAGPTIPSAPTTFTVPQENEGPSASYDALLVVPLEPALESYSLSVVVEQELTEATITRNGQGRCSRAASPRVPDSLARIHTETDAATD